MNNKHCNCQKESGWMQIIYFIIGMLFYYKLLEWGWL